jgi:hypothetical protein
MSQSLRQRAASRGNGSGNSSATTNPPLSGLNNTGLSAELMQRASPQHTGKVGKLRLPLLYAMLPQFLQRIVLKIRLLSFLRPTWQPRHLMLLGSYLYKFKDEDDRNLSHQQPNGSPVRLNHMNVYLVTSAHEDYDAIVASGLRHNAAHDSSSVIFCVSTFRKKYYYACINHEEAMVWVNTLRDACHECVTRSMGHATKDSFPSNWKYYDAIAHDLVSRKDRIRNRLQQSNLRELEMSNFSEGGPLPRGYYG